MPQFFSQKPSNYSYFVFAATILGCSYFSYFLERQNFILLFSSYTTLSLLFLYLIQQNFSWKILLLYSVVIRLVFIVATPNLSQDFYRFIWDGRMLLNGFNPYLYLPESFLNTGLSAPNQAAGLIKGMGALNASHYSNYPPLNQLCFFISALIANNSIIGSIISLRLLIILADLGVLYFGSKLLKSQQLNPKFIFIYLLNPLILIELTGNLHFEGVMLFFLIWALYLLQKKHWKTAAIIFAFSINLKLLPLLFLPLFFKYFNIKKLLAFYAIIALTTLAGFTPFLCEELISNYSKTLSLWFGTFEFNGSLYLIVREIGYYIKGYNIIHTVGKITPIIVLLSVLIISFTRNNKNTKQLLTSFLIVLSIYLFTSSTIHPWYISMLLLLSIYTNYKFPLVWSFTIIFSYSFYNNDAFLNNYYLIFIEYAVVFSYMIWEIYTLKKKQLC